MAKRGFNISLDGLEAIISGLDGYLEKIDRLDETLTRIALKIIDDAKKLAPIDTGDLEAALMVDEVKQLVGSMYIDFGASVDVDHYAVVQHEGYFTPGEKTRSKPMHGGYMPGRKYLENAIKMNEKWIIEELKKTLELG